ncbi:EexN family lipoprotein [Sedimentitalea sp.]|uniref:EexN family lipoprotein n=1 Tax=Sedimentitalea sp. TaxID=2048915 RepID=UPI00329997B0
MKLRTGSGSAQTWGHYSVVSCIQKYAIISLLAVSACQEDENKTVEFFLENPEARAEILAKCEVTDAATLDANCKNALDAEIRSSEAATRKKNLSDMNTLFGD